MKKLNLLILASIVAIGTTACSTAKTSADAPDTIGGEVENPQNVEETLEDATSNTRQAQLNADIQAREQRNQWAGDPLKRADADLASEVRAKLEANIPRAKLTVEADDGVVTIAGTVPDSREYQTVEPLAREIKGVEEVNLDVQIVPPNN